MTSSSRGGGGGIQKKGKEEKSESRGEWKMALAPEISGDFADFSPAFYRMEILVSWRFSFFKWVDIGQTTLIFISCSQIQCLGGHTIVEKWH